MILSRVIGNAVSTVKHPCYAGVSVLVCVPVQTDGHAPVGPEFLAVDSVQAGPGDLVLVAREGNAARQILGEGQPYHAVILGVVDEVNEPGREIRTHGAHRAEAEGGHG
jgi:ethanolamine utilization protein EutN